MSIVLPQSSCIYEQCNIKAIVKVSKLILETYPYTSFQSLVDGNDIEWSRTLGCSSDQLEELINNLISIWKYVIYNVPKMEGLKDLLMKTTNNDQLSDVLIALWNEEGSQVISRIGKITLSNSPRVRDVHISTDLQLSNDSNKDERKVQATFNFETDKGPREVKLTKEELFKLYEEVSNIQKAIDNLLE